MDKVKPIFILCLGLGLLPGQSHADDEFLGCYARCFVLCMIKPHWSRMNAVRCGLKCLQHCIHPSSEILNDTSHFCKLGCAVSSCSNLSSEDNPNEKAVAGCVDSCSETCTDHV